MTADREQALRRRHRHERQAVVFGSLVAALAVAGLGAAASYTGVMSFPFLEREFTSPEPEATALIPDPPCPAEGALPVAYAEVQVTVLNASGRAGLAGSTAEDLRSRGFGVLDTGNYALPLAASNQVSFGPGGVAAAYTLAAHLTDPILMLDTREDARVDLILGSVFPGLLDPSTIVLDPAAPLEHPEGCVPLEEALEKANPPIGLEPDQDEATLEEQPVEPLPDETEPPADG
ncbi:LytR C-terminal domain-containing protein [Actinotalea sp. K2]|uniref:LytR C-terminal domain-containing protein n=1 Tax=Actinotalea sp. K2 TaxID=2939438 RepID=UPI002017F85B|nr:LytR C-terminal domain-containing protein [Actinotalea sp. K2]MCL3859686.1 LytR C-terminal domain-containing protein [Actinotalea sp. K2]